MDKKSKDSRQARREKSFIMAYLKGEKSYITDVSEQGCQVFYEKDRLDTISKEDILELKVELPGYDSKGNINFFPIKGKVMWIEEMDDFLILGVHFEELKTGNSQAIKKITAYWHFLNSTFGPRDL